MIDDDQLSQSKAIQRRTGKTFHLATRLLPERIRHPTYVLYAFFRVSDQVVDDPGNRTPEEQRVELDRIREAALGHVDTDDPVLAAFSDVRERHGIPEKDVDEFLDAMHTDVRTTRYATYEELEEYVDGSAAAVGRMMTHVMDPPDLERALPHATALGVAFQLTNMLRDVREDVRDHGRIYLPQSTLEEHGVTAEQIRAAEMDERFAAAMRAEIDRTERLYETGVAGIELLPEDCQLAVLLSAVLYVDHHRLIRERGYDTLTATPELSTLRKLRLLARTRWKWAWNDDPEAVFYDAATGFGGEARQRSADPPETPTNRPS